LKELKQNVILKREKEKWSVVAKSMDSMIANNAIIVTLVISVLAYILPELFFQSAMLYFSGGVIGGTISEVIKGVSGERNDLFTFLLWGICLVGLVLFFWRVPYKPIKLLIFPIIAFFLYLIDNLIAVTPIWTKPELPNTNVVRIVVGFSILLKSVILATINSVNKRH
jgi:hypothetical protein